MNTLDAILIALAPYRKAVIAGIVACLSTAAVLAGDGLSLADVLSALGVGVAALGGTYAAPPNQPKK